MTRFASAIVLMTLFLATTNGCYSEGRSSILQIGDTQYALELVGPDNKNHYRYRIREDGETVVDSFLGPIAVESRTKWKTIEIEPSVYMIEFGEREYAGRVKVDVGNRRIVYDSNGSNPKYNPFDERTK